MLFCFSFHRKSQSPAPAGHDIPAITAVIQNPRLFTALLNCLTNPPFDEHESKQALIGGGANHHRVSSLGSHGITTGRGGRITHRGSVISAPPVGAAAAGGGGRGRGASAGRKRCASFSEPELNNHHPNKAIKVQPHQSPMVKTHRPLSVGPDIPIRVLAATIFTVAFAHLDHWPAPLVQAYAEDAFGPRSWVDDVRCSLIVQNIQLCHEDGDEPMVSDEALTEAAQVAHFYDSMLKQMAASTQNAPPRQDFQPIQNSHDRDRSMSMDSIDQNHGVYRSSSMDSADLTKQEESDSDSGEEEIMEVSMGHAAPNRTSNGGDSSSSGEEEIEEEGGGNRSVDERSPIGSRPQSPSGTAAETLYPVKPPTVNLVKVRHRYVGVNAQLAFEGISTALEERLETKSKQNSNLLKALPSFTSIPGVRAQTALRLGQWLQSPALSGPARSLFAATVNHMKHVDPPLKEDMEAVDAILSMRLKSNQLNMHIENVTNIAKRIPTGAVSRHIYLKLLKEELSHIERDPNQTQSEHLAMIGAVNSALDPSLSCDALAAAILTFLADEDFHAEKIGRYERHKFIRKIRVMIRRVNSILGTSFDGCRLVESLLSFDMGVQSWRAEDEEDKGRIMLECVSLLVPPLKDRDDLGSLRGKQPRKLPMHSDTFSTEEINDLKRKLLAARKFLINWCCSDYAPMIQAEQKTTLSIHEMIRKRTLTAKRGETPAGAGAPDFSSILDGQHERSKDSTCPVVIQCMLFMVEPDSKEMQAFLYPDGAPQSSDPLWTEEQYRLRQCYDYGADLDDEMLWIVLQSSTTPDRTLDHSLALVVIEHLFECCRNDRKASMNLCDPRIVWEMYNLVEYISSFQPFPEENYDTETEERENEENGARPNGFKPRGVPRLAFPGQWWRVTALALIMCAKAPKKVGEILCREHPTIEALVKMVVSGRYRFPTVDCNEAMREAMKAGEADLRDEESRITELLFLPPKPKEKTKSNNGQSGTAHGSRTSARNRSRLERIERQKREKEASDALAAALKRKKMLKTAQKSIMVLNPKAIARKPPKECMNIILSVEDMFSLANVFHRSIDPDFVLVALGSTTRGAIERAYDWLIPVVSMLPSIIGRLPASASCFLLLRAYGSEGDGSAELRQLSAPLLDHVTKTVCGEYGEEDAVGAIDLLIADVADKKPERRQCARMVLQEALAQQNASVTDKSFHAARCTWLHGLLLVKHATSMVTCVIHYISQALKYETGRVLRAELLSLDRYIRFAAEHDVKGSWDFPSILCSLVSRRHAVFSGAMERFTDVKTMSIKVIHSEFKSYLATNRENEIPDGDLAVGFSPCSLDVDLAGEESNKRVIIPLSLLESTCVLLSTWKAVGTAAEEDSNRLINELANIMMHPYEVNQDVSAQPAKNEGAISAVLNDSGKPAVAVDKWVLLAKSRTDFIARRASLSAPTKFLPRLLLCSGLPHSSLITMIDRLGLLGFRSDDANKIYKDLMMPSATCDWSISHIGGRKELARKLIGRLSAYLKHDNGSALEGISKTFLVWLSEECTNQAPEKSKKKQQRRLKSANQPLTPNALSSLSKAGSILTGLSRNDSIEDFDLGESDSIPKLAIRPSLKMYEDELPSSDNAGRVLVFVRDCIEDDQVEKLESWIGEALANQTVSLKAGIIIDKLVEVGGEASAGLNQLILNWLPRLVTSSPMKGWSAIFMSKWKETIGDELVSRCALSWCANDIRACSLWASTLSDEERHGLDPHQLVNFLVMTNTAQISTSDTFGGCMYNIVSAADQGVGMATKLAILCSRSDTSETIEARNAVPSWLQLLTEVGKKSKKTMGEIIHVLLNEIGIYPDNEPLKSALLRLYCLFPTMVNTGNAVLRNIIVEGCKRSTWLDWRSPLDAQIEDTLRTMRVSPCQRLAQGLIDLAKMHPLLILRTLRAMRQVLEADGMYDGPNRTGRSRVWGENLNGPAEALYHEKAVKVKVQHWGYMFTDSLWVSIIETLLLIPPELLFPCGLAMGIQELLETYVKLLLTQSTLYNHDKTARLKGRFCDLLGVFEKSYGWHDWLASKDHDLKSLGSMRNILISCGLITTDQAMSTIRAK